MTAARIREVQGRALAEGHGAAVVALYGALVTSLAELLGAEDANTAGFPDDPVLQAAMREVDESTRAHICAWVCAEWLAISAAAAVLDALDEVPDALLPIPAGAMVGYRKAAEDLALRAGDTCAAVAWAGGAAIAQWLRLYGGRTVTDMEMCAADPVLEAARRELSREQLLNVTVWVHRNWIEIDDLASERAS